MSKTLEKLRELQDLVGADLEGLEGISTPFPFIQWAHDKATIHARPARGGFVMTQTNIDEIGDIPAGAQMTAISFRPDADNPEGSDAPCAFAHELEFAPLAVRSAWFYERLRLPRDFDYKSYAGDGAKPKSKTQILALVKGEKGMFLVMLTFSSTAAKDVKNALSEHNKAVQAALRTAKITNKSVRANGWRWFWLKLAAGKVEIRGEGKNTSAATSIEYAGTGEYIGALREEHFDAEGAREFEAQWRDDPARDAGHQAPPPMPEGPPDEYDDIPF